MANSDPPSASQGSRVVYCLCAEWCGVCREWRSNFDALAAAQPGVRFAWVDVDAQEEVLDTVDIETFPVLLIAEAGQVLFFGPLQPSAAILARLLAHAGPAPTVAPQAQALLALLQPLA